MFKEMITRNSPEDLSIFKVAPALRKMEGTIESSLLAAAVLEIAQEAMRRPDLVAVSSELFQLTDQHTVHAVTQLGGKTLPSIYSMWGGSVGSATPAASAEFYNKYQSVLPCFRDDGVIEEYRTPSGLSLWWVNVYGMVLCLIRSADLDAFHQLLSTAKSKKGFNICVDVFPKAAREELERMKFFFDNADDLDKHNLPKQYGMLLYGLPGTGKSVFARYVGQQMKREVYQYTFADLLCMQQDEQHLPYGGVTLLDDIDAAVLCTSSNLTSYLLDEVQATHTGIDRVLILATNNPQDIAPALRRPGRFGRWIHFSGMGEPEFRAMLRMYECDCADTLKYTTGCTPAAVQATAQAYYGRAVDSWEAAMSATLDQKIEND